MKLKDLLLEVDEEGKIQKLGPEITNIEITGIAYDSRDVKEGNIFVARRGAVKYVDEAIKKGATFLILEEDLQVTIPKLIVKDARKGLAILASKFYNHPSRKLKVIGVTGTFGKTTSTWLIKAVFEKARGNTGLIGTIRYEIGEKILTAHHTTPEALELQRFFYELLQKGVKTVVMEVSSHAIALSRVHGIDFDIGGFTRLDRDHLDFHGTMQEYKETKIRFFESLKPSAIAILNHDDPTFSEFRTRTKAKVVTYGTTHSDVCGEIRNISDKGIEIGIKWNGNEGRILSPMLGSYNFYNILLAVTCGLVEEIEFDTIRNAIEEVKGIPGRFERIGRVIIDYAHTPGALKWCLTSAREIAKRRVICIFGCGGDRDKGKRPEMGKIASQLADYVIITTDNPRSEDPASIAQDIIKGIEYNNYEIELDRKEAIRKAILRSTDEDIVVVVGKGHEKYQIIGEVTIPWSDSEVVEEILSEKGG